MSQSDKNKVARVLKQFFDDVAAYAGRAQYFDVTINKQYYRSLDIGHIVKTFSDTVNDQSEPQIEIVDVSQRAANALPAAFRKDNRGGKRTAWLKELDGRIVEQYCQSAQIKTEARNTYIRICQLIDMALTRQGLSLRREAQRYSDGFSFYNPYQIIYRLSLEIVREYYLKRRVDFNFYEAEKIKQYFGKYVYQSLTRNIGLLTAKIEDADAETLKALNLTSYGTPILWWDVSGQWRDQHVLSTLDIEILQQTSPRTTMVWQMPDIVKYITRCYLALYQRIFSARQLIMRSDCRYALHLIKAIDNFLESASETPYHTITTRLICSRHLLKISEQAVREQLPRKQALDLSGDWRTVRHLYGEQIVEQLKDELSIQQARLTDRQQFEIRQAYSAEKTSDWRFKCDHLRLSAPELRAELFVSWSDDRNLTKICRHLLKMGCDQNIMRLACYHLAKQNQLTSSGKKRLNRLIDPANHRHFWQLVDENRPLSDACLQDLQRLAAPIRKTISLDSAHLRQSQRDFISTVQKIDEFADDRAFDLLESATASQMTEEEQLQTSKHHALTEKAARALLREILQKGMISHARVETRAAAVNKMVSVYLAEINRMLYPLVEDQVLIESAQGIAIDQFYIEDIKEYIENAN